MILSKLLFLSFLFPLLKISSNGNCSTTTLACKLPTTNLLEHVNIGKNTFVLFSFRLPVYVFQNVPGLGITTDLVL